MYFELEDGRLINTDAILELDPRLRRIKFIYGGQHNLSPDDTDKLKNALIGEKPKTPKRVPSKRVATKDKE